MFTGHFEFSRYLTTEQLPQNFHISANKRTMGHPFPVHWHEYFEMELILNGKATGRINGQPYQISQGSLYLLSPTDFHSIDGVAEEVELINISFDDSIITGNLLFPLFYSNKVLVYQLQENTLKIIKQHAECLVFETENNFILRKNYIINILECLLIEIFRQEMPEMADYSQKESILSALAFVHAHFRENPSLSDAAKKSGYSLNYFCDAFKRTTGKTYKEYLTALKLDYAKKLISSTNSTVTEVCYACGFNTLSHFLREFKRHYKLTPKELKEKGRLLK